MAAAGLAVPSIAVMADDVAVSKPDPEGFLKAAGLLGVDPADCIVFEDSRAGVTAARAAGMRVIGVGDAAAFEPDHVVPDLTAVTVTPTPDGVEVTVRP
jgi:sugar-phosphatase